MIIKYPGSYIPCMQFAYSQEKEFFRKDEVWPNRKLDVEKSSELVERNLGSTLDEINKKGLETKLIKFITKSIAAHINDNLDKFEGTIDEKVDAAALDIGKKLPWIAEMMKMFNITPDTISKFLTGIIRLLFESMIAAV